MVIGGYEPKGVVAALGNFDGVHIGHQKLFECLKDLAAEHGDKLFPDFDRVSLSRVRPNVCVVVFSTHTLATLTTI